MSDRIEVHGRKSCPFAWRVRLAAHEKGVPFDWIPFDVPSPDPRAAHNPDRKSPLLVHGDFHLVESDVIAAYLDEGFPGRGLFPADARDRAEARLLQGRLSAVRPAGPPGTPLTDAARTALHEGFDRLESALASGAAFLGGDAPSLVDLLLWPMLDALDTRGAGLTEAHPQAHAYWARSRSRASFTATAP